MDRIDLNCDAGESIGLGPHGDDAEIFPYVSSANVACGFHAGGPITIRATCQAAVLQDVVVGAHPSYRDRAGFGRRFIDVAPAELTSDIITQIDTLQQLAGVEGATVRYVKPHGALYNAIVHHESQARAVVDALLAFDGSLPLVVPPFSMIGRLAEEAGIRTVVEAFADRAYTSEGGLVPRDVPGSVLQSSAQVIEQVRRIIDGEVVSIDGSRIKIDAETVCIHGDTPGAIELAARVRSSLDDAGIHTRSFMRR